MQEKEDTGMTELHRLLRPTRWKDVVGQSEAVSILRGFEEDHSWPHCILLSGPPGCGKTTIGRIIANKLGCIGTDFKEINAASNRGIETVRELEDKVGMAPRGEARVWLVDEIHRWTLDAMSSALKLFEDTPRKAYFILATTEPKKLLKAIQTRCTHITLKALSDADMRTLLDGVKNKIDGSEILTDKLTTRIIECSEGSARQALNFLNKVLKLPTEAERLNAIQKAGDEVAAYDVVKKLLWAKTKWGDIAEMLGKLAEGDNDYEGIRNLVIACARKELLTGKNPGWAALIIEFFKEPWYSNGDARLAWCCYEVLRIRNG